nr:WbqC family protein [Mycobacterium lehmannii]
MAILQSNYIPWRGYFDLIAFVDEFILYDDAQYTKNDWRNRNRIKTRQGWQWITVPVVKRFGQKISETMIDGDHWASKHWRTLEFNYSAAPYFAEVAEWLAPIYLQEEHDYLALLNRHLLEAICDYLNISTNLTKSSDYELSEGKTEKLVYLCRQAGATEYVSGPAARSYLDEPVFEECGIEVSWFDYDGYQEYPQLWGEFVPAVSIVDLLFNVGPNAPDHLRYGRRGN